MLSAARSICPWLQLGMATLHSTATRAAVSASTDLVQATGRDGRDGRAGLHHRTLPQIHPQRRPSKSLSMVLRMWPYPGASQRDVGEAGQPGRRNVYQAKPLLGSSRRHA